MFGLTERLERLERQQRHNNDLLLEIRQQNHLIITKFIEMNTSLQNLQTEVAQDTDVTNAGLKLIDGLVQQVKDAGTDPAALDALTAQLSQNRSALAAAIAQNTPAQPTVS